MPHILINKLKHLVAMDFPSQLQATNPFLNKGPSPLPEEILDLIDNIAETAQHVFGNQVQPSVRQADIMLEHNFPIQPGRVATGIWKSGVIVTSKGLIEY